MTRDDRIAALDAIGAPQMAAIVREANRLFPDGVPPRDRELRQEQLDALSERIRAWMTGKLEAMDQAELETVLLAFAALRKAFH